MKYLTPVSLIGDEIEKELRINQQQETRNKINKHIQELKQLGASCKTCLHRKNISPYWPICLKKNSKPIQYYNICEQHCEERGI